ncbi:unnamed protein product [Paramecium sonneborni]|uniref:PIPK domain-containing protein n=1 Tax=Paramecium sonneborni TaxID=65129 RepID=A0A8S1KL33_9CILI|nr:unnamed protein product [Paramecium sonneborni]
MNNQVTIAYIDIGCTALSMVACLLICILGIVSPIYRKYPSKIIVWISYLFIFLGIFIYIDQAIVIINHNHQNEYKELHKLTDFFLGVTIIIISNQFILFLNEVKICIYNPFQATSSSVFLFLLFLQTLLTLVLIIIPLVFYNYITQYSQLASYINFGSFLICLIFYFAILSLLYRNKTLQSRRLFEFKRDFVRQQAYWLFTMLLINFAFSFYNLNANENDDSNIFKIALSLEGLFYSIFHLIQPYSYHKLLSLLFRSCQNQSDIQAIENIEYGINEDNQNQMMPIYEKLLKTQINELVKGLVKAVLATLNMQFEHHMKEFEKKRTYTFKFHLSELDESRIEFTETDDIRDSIILVNTYHPNSFTTLLKSNHFTKNLLEYTLELQYNQKAFEKTKESMGRSGAFFFFSQNNKLIIKTIEKSEIKDFLDGRIVSYFNYINSHQKSLIAKIYGIFKIKLMAYKTQYLVLMENTFEQLKQLDYEFVVYDLKGSTVNRTSQSNESVQKDNNFKQSSHNPIYLPKEISQQIKIQLQDDCTFLRNIGYMDYSLLLGICTENVQQKETQNYRLVINEEKNKLFSFSIIDYLQRFNQQKKSEQCFKRSLKFKKKKDLSCRSPEPYCDRFINFINSIIV